MTTPKTKKKKPVTSKRYRVARGLSGLGLVAVAPIARGETVIEYTGEIIGNKEADRREARGNRYIMWVARDVSIDGTTRKNVARYVNHSCRPNVFIREQGHRVFYVAKRGIRIGEEIVTSYGKEYFDLFLKGACRCGEEKHLA